MAVVVRRTVGVIERDLFRCRSPMDIGSFDVTLELPFIPLRLSLFREIRT